MAVYTSLSHEEIRALLAGSYALGQFVDAQGIAQGVQNTNYSVSTRTEDGALHRYILTLYEARTNPDDLPFFTGLMQHVAQRGIACPQPMPRLDGALVGQVAGKPASLVSFLQGESRSTWTAVHAASVGEALAGLHIAAQDFSGRRANALSLGGWQQLHRSVAARLENISHGLAAFVADELAYLAQHWPQVAALPQGIIHADLFPDNVFFTGDAVSGLIDFYFACNDALAYDVAVTMNAWCFEAVGEFSREKSQALLAHYQQLRPLSAAEREALPLLLRGAAMRFLLTRAYDWVNRDPNALVHTKDPMEYVAALRFHQQVQSLAAYGI